MTRPEFIVCIDKTAGAGNGGWYIRALIERDIIDAMDRVETAIVERAEAVYAVTLFKRVIGTTGKNTKYAPVIMARMNHEYPRPVKWTRRNEVNREEPWSAATWTPTDDNRNGFLSFDDGGILQTNTGYAGI